MYIKEFKVEKKLKVNVKTIIIVVLFLLIIIFLCLYKLNIKFRDMINKVIELAPSVNFNVSDIYIEQDKINAIMCNDKYLTILSQNVLTGYTTSENSEFEENVNIANAIFDSNGKYMVIAEKNAEKMYLFSGKTMIYSTQLDGTIFDVTVNKNGYVAVNISKSGYRSVVSLFNPQGEKVFTTYFATTFVSDMAISNNNKLLAISEIDTSGIKVLSGIKFVQIDRILEKDNIIKTENETDSLISKIVFANNNNLIYITDKKVEQINVDGTKTMIYDITDKNITNVDISLGNYIVVAKKIETGIFNTNTDISIFDRDGKEIGKYSTDRVVKQLSVNSNVIAIGMGQEIHFVTVTGRLIKKYTAEMDIKEAIMYNDGKSVALIYRNKIELMNI